MKSISYNECLQEMYGLGRFGIKLGLETIDTILDNLGRPEKSFKSIHIAGTNGKGSIASYIASILNEAGFKTGLYTSPHLVKFNERFCINGTQVIDDDIVDAYLAVKNADTGTRKATFFELATAMGFYLFGRENVEWAVIETGMGGRLDATNILNPELSVITNLSLEHTDYLGDTLEAITGEKGGIIKQNTPVVTGVTQDSSLAVLKEIAGQKSAPFYLYKKDFTARADGDRSFTYNGIKTTWDTIETQLPGRHQIDNAALSLAACELIFSNTAQLSQEVVRKGIKETRWPGRLEYILEKPLTILDGAHNLKAAENLGRYFNEKLSDRDLTLVIGILDDKPYDEMLKYLVPSAKKIIFTKAGISRSLDPEILKKSVQDYAGASIRIIENVGEAVDYAVKTSTDSDAVCVAGSLYVVGEARNKIKNDFKPD